jgi:hypothetical protein
VASGLRGDIIVSSETRWGPIVGAWLQHWVSDNFAVGFEVNYIQKGGLNVVTQATDRDTLTDLTLGYLEFPLIVRGALGLGAGFELSGHLGLAFAINTATSAKVNGIGVALPDTLKATQQTTFNVPVGAGLAWYLNDKRSVFSVDARYAVGVNDVFKDSGVKADAWEFLVRYGVRFGEGDSDR